MNSHRGMLEMMARILDAGQLGIPAKSLAAFVGSDRTTKRYIAEARHLGADVVAVRSGRGWIYVCRNDEQVRSTVAAWLERERLRDAELDSSFMPHTPPETHQKEEAMQIEINEDVARELAYVVRLHQEHGAPAQMDSVERLVGYILACVADGSRRPGSWERGMLTQMGLIADCDEHHEYRATYGDA